MSSADLVVVERSREVRSHRAVPSVLWRIPWWRAIGMAVWLLSAAQAIAWQATGRVSWESVRALPLFVVLWALVEVIGIRLGWWQGRRRRGWLEGRGR